MKGGTVFLSCCFALSNINTSVFAGVRGDVAANNWVIGGSVLSLVPSVPDPSPYAIISPYVNSGSTASERKSVYRHIHAAFDVFVKYNLNQANQDITLNYMQFSGSDNDKTGLKTHFNFPYVYQQFYYTAEGNAANNLYVADLVLGQNISFQSMKFNFFGGVAYAYLRNYTDYIYDFDQLMIVKNALNPHEVERTNTFNGAGLKLGIKSEYRFSKTSWGLTGGASAALLVGSQSLRTSEFKFTSSIIRPPGQYPTGPFNVKVYTGTTYNDPNLTTITNINLNLGLIYRPQIKVPINVEIGGRINQYINFVSIAGGYLTISSYS